MREAHRLRSRRIGVRGDDMTTQRAGECGPAPAGRRQGVPIYAAGRVVGCVYGQTFVKTLDYDRHVLHRPEAIAFDMASLAEAERAGASQCRITVKRGEGRQVYTASLADIRRKGFRVSRRFGEQIALALEHWTLAGEGRQLVLL